MLGECKDNRQGFIDLWRTYDGIKISDLSIFSVLNHSRMASSTIKWRPNVRKDIMILIQNSSEYIWSYTTQTANFLTEKVKSKTIDSILNIWYDAKPILQNFIDDIRDTKNLQEDIEQFKVLYNESYYANEFYMRDIYHIYLVIAEEISFRHSSGHVPRIFNEIWDILGGTGESIRQSILWIVESVSQNVIIIKDILLSFCINILKSYTLIIIVDLLIVLFPECNKFHNNTIFFQMKNLYEKFQRFLKSVMSGDTLNQLTQNLQEIAGKYDKVFTEH
ncbi:hypothetical protein AAG570_012454 [Ranatra chinensis]|uniref:Uncharacterized protein n=1 Tax=Ranatra chinensis TaxID=642074 RepID=A0ABD0Z258_9HEMI